MSDNNAGATRYGTQEEFDYDGFEFSDDFPIPSSYVVAYGMAHFRGPDSFLWFAPDDGSGTPGFAWGAAQNVAEFDHRWEAVDDPYYADVRYQQVVDDLCQALDTVIAAEHRYSRMQQVPPCR
jgi:hypothetical protein